jgi:hypothetical protein
MRSIEQLTKEILSLPSLAGWALSTIWDPDDSTAINVITLLMKVSLFGLDHVQLNK